MMGRILVFPAGAPRSLAFLEQASLDGREVIGSSSLLHDPAKVNYSRWCYLPFVTDESFGDSLKEVVSRYSITDIFTPNIVVWNFLNRVLKDVCPGVSLLNSSPLERETQPYRKALDFARLISTDPLEIASASPKRPPLPLLRTASLFHHSELLPGMCDHEKIKALCGIFRHCPNGDIVEIGSWWGKSAFVLASLARGHGIGSVLCVDPWADVHLKQDDARGLVDSVPADTEEAFRIFQINLMPYIDSGLNFLRLPSKEASGVYRQGNLVVSESFGETRYLGGISLLHIDGNHSYASVKEDIASWGDLVINGGWIIFDDYVWPYGDGPKRVADEYISARMDDIEVAFAMGSALFLQLK